MLTLLATSVGLFMIFLDATIVNVALPDIQRGLRRRRARRCSGWSPPTASRWACSSCRRPRFADRRGRRLAFIGGIVLFSAASALCAAGAEPRLAQHRPRAAGRRCGDRQRGLARARERRLPRSEGQGEGDRHLDGHRLGRPGDRSDRRRLPDRDRSGWRSIFFVNVGIGAGRHLAGRGPSWTSRATPRPRGLDLPGQVLFIVAVGALDLRAHRGTARRAGSRRSSSACSSARRCWSSPSSWPSCARATR